MKGWTDSPTADCSYSQTQVYTGDTYSARLAATNTGTYTYIQRAMSTSSYTQLKVSYARYLNDSTTGSFVAEYLHQRWNQFCQSGNRHR